MAGRIYSAIRPYLGGLAIFLGCVGFFAFVVFIPIALFSTHFWTGFSPDATGMTSAERDASILQSLRSDAVTFFGPLFLGSVTLLVYGIYEARVEQKSRARCL